MDHLLSLLPASDALAPVRRRKSGGAAAGEAQTPAAKRQRSSHSHSLTQPSFSTRTTPSSYSSSAPPSSSSRLSRLSGASASQPAPVPTSLSPPSLLAFTRPFSIVRVTMTNFMCYESHTVYLGPHLNLVIGPNGAGKSTLVCAICLALGGMLSSLGRMDEVADFIKKDEQSAVVEVELFAGMTGKEADGNRCIRRVLHQDNKSTFYDLTPSASGQGWREAEVTMKRVKELMQGWDVHVDNLCVLLAQDRVGKFAEMKPTELLVETERAANVEYYDQHQHLIELRKQERDYEKTAAALARSVDAKSQELAAMEPEMKRREERKDEEEKMAVMKRRRPWAELRNEEQKGVALNDKRDAIARQEQEEKDKQRPLKAVLQRSVREWKSAEEKKGDVTAACMALSTRRRDTVEALKAVTAHVDTKRNEVRRVEDDEQQHEQELERRTARLQQQQQVVIQLPAVTEAQEALRSAREESKALMRENAEVISEKSEMQRDAGVLRMQMSEIESRRTARRHREQNRAEALFRKVGSHKHKAEYELVRAARERHRQHRVKMDSDPSYIDAAQRNRFDDPQDDAYVFKGDVYGPLVLEVDFKDDQVGGILENLLNFNRKMMYIAQHRDDWLWLTSRVSMVTQRRAAQSNKLSPEALNHRVDLRRFQHLGIVGYIYEGLSAPPLVMAFLAEQFPVTVTPYGRKELSAAELDEIFPTHVQPPGQPFIQALYTPAHEHSIRFSKYGSRDRSLTDKILEKPRLFSRTLEEDGEGEEEKMAELRAALQKKEEELTEVRKREEAIARKHRTNGEARERWEAALRKDRAERDRLAQYKRELDALKREAGVEAKKQRLRREIDKAQQLQVQRIAELVDFEQQWVEASMHVDVWTLQAQHKLSEKEFIENKASAFGHTIKRILDERKKADDELRRHEHRVHGLRLAAQRECKEEEVMGLDWLPDDLSLEELDDRMEVSQATLDSFRAGDDVELVQRYEALKKEVDELTHQQQAKDDAHAQHSQLITQLKAEWLTSIRALVAEVNTSFALYFRRLDRAVGEVSLLETTEFEQYAIMIRVCFNVVRDEKPHMNVLSHHFQSGGEKSVATMLYLLSLQGVTDAPFRIVDEINQGMDHRNEERIFNQLVYASAEHKDRTVAVRRAGQRAARGEDAADVDGDDGKEERMEGQQESPQYIVVSPKLLPNLDMPEEVGLRVIIMMAGAMGKESADRKRRAPGAAVGWERPMKAVQCADQWLSRRQQQQHSDDLTPAHSPPLSDDSDDTDSDDSDDALDVNGDDEKDEEPQPRAKRGRPQTASRAKNGDAGESEEVDVILELSRHWDDEDVY